jgi:hypothetical protein
MIRAIGIGLYDYGNSYISFHRHMNIDGKESQQGRAIYASITLDSSIHSYKFILISNIPLTITFVPFFPTTKCYDFFLVLLLLL